MYACAWACAAFVCVCMPVVLWMASRDAGGQKKGVWHLPKILSKVVNYMANVGMLGQDWIHLHITNCPTLHQLPGGYPGHLHQWFALCSLREECECLRTKRVTAIGCMMIWSSYLFDVQLPVFCKCICLLICIKV